jgi:hypothetical protein
VTTKANGFEHVDTADPATVTTGTDGKAAITFNTPGWHRVKATVPGAGEEEAIRSNRLDVCVPAPGQSDCGAPPVEDQVRAAPGGGEGPGDGSEAGGPGPGPGGGTPTGDPSGSASGDSTGGGSSVGDPGGSPSDADGCSAGGRSGAEGGGPSQPACTTARPAPLRVAAPRLDRSKLRQGVVGVSWKVLGAGVQARRWTVSSQVIGRGKAPYVERASGTRGTAAALRLPRGHAYRLRLTIVDALGRTSNLTLGKVVVPGGRRG